jgi:hypothetical protein
MLLIQNRRVNRETCQMGSRVPRRRTRRTSVSRSIRRHASPRFRTTVGARQEAFVLGSATGAYQPNIQTAWERLKLLAYAYEARSGRQGVVWTREQLQRIDLRWHDVEA